MTVLTSTRGARDLPRWFSPAFSTLSKLQRGSVDVTLPDGRVFRAEGREPGVQAALQIHNDDLLARVMRDGDVGFAEAYMDGWWDTPDLQALMDVVCDTESVSFGYPGQSLVRAYEKARFAVVNRNTRAQAKKNIAHHYDLGNEFYSAWLDPSMTYSSAIYDSEDDLGTAQARKYNQILDGIGAKEGDRLLEIGCGWGGFAEHAAMTRGARVRALTISQAQHDYAARRIFEAGLAERVEVVLQDYRDEQGSYDGIASIEMFEAVGERYWPVYFKSLNDRLTPGARATLQVITIQDRFFDTYKKSVDFIQKYIFPGGMLPSPSVLRAEGERAGLRVEGSIEFGQSYSRTLREWHDAFQVRWPEISALGFDERFRRMWAYYLTSCAACFKSGMTDVTQISMSRPA